MKDNQIVDLYWARSEKAISETSNKYGHYCYYIAYNILHSKEDSEECVNDTYLNAWNAMPDQRPNILSAFLGRITRNLSLQRWNWSIVPGRWKKHYSRTIGFMLSCRMQTDGR
ncbi:RNA polymerase sigma factor [Butyrivibrio sp. INlla14]|uniref:RNA polymerase sigma factor n=1 Tax=Butyrivibrio sp. INlla14 TaxID=1520808 RepID=UPI000876B485|nr:sigma factor [Butyrivibrio sp. INlla14]SCY60195.1 Sigma-70 region 2 [Butyrivibrio sp. INlla14]